MAGEREDYPKLPIPVIVSLALALIAWWLVSEPLVSTRPEGGRPGSMQEQLVQARLWQDPVEAVQGDDAKKAVSHFGFTQTASAQHIAVLIVMTEGGPYVENHEKRLRDRYAVVSALAAACFAPSNSEHIGSFLLPDWEKSPDRGKPVPFEWYEVQPRGICYAAEPFADHEQVLVVWTTESMFGDEPVHSLNRLVGSLMSDYWADTCSAWHSLDCFSKLAIKLIGPPDSPTLRTMLESAGTGKAVFPEMVSPYWPQGIELYSPWATADPKLLLRGVANTHDPCSETVLCEQMLRDRLKKVGIVLRHAVISDRELTLALAYELQRRQVDLEGDSIAVVSEWDTFYGRALPIAFEHSVKHVTGASGQPNIRRYSYLRGLDGLTPEDSKKNEQRDAKKGKSSSLQEATARAENLQELERPDGQSQLDYLRRLAARMRKDVDLRGKMVQAIGVLGSDIHDVKLILRALRDEFPHALFFTTTLDARLFDVHDYPWTRNVIIASPFGLELHEALQRDIPPFRDSYQTSAFFSVLRAVGHIRWPGETAESRMRCKETNEVKTLQSNFYDDIYNRGDTKTFRALLCPRLFEIGRRGPVDLSADRTALQLNAQELAIQPVRELLPQGMKKWWLGLTTSERLGITESLVSCGLALCILFVVFTRSLGAGANYFHDLAKELKAGTWKVILLVGAVTLYSLILFFFLFLYAKESALLEGWEGEPISFMDGVSIWPSVVIRVIVIGWCVGCVFIGWMHLWLSHARLRNEYFLEGIPAQVFWKSFVRSMFWVLAVPKTESPTWIDQIYREYQSAGLLRCRLMRATIFTLIYGVFLMIVLAFLPSGPPLNPCRGSFNCTFSAQVLKGAALAMIFLNMFVFDAVLLCQGFVLRMEKVEAQSWPPGIQDRYETEQRALYLSRVLPVRLVADHTETLHRLVFCPFIALLLMIGSRNRYFDNWDFPSGLIIVWVVYAFIALTSIVRLKGAASRVRESSLKFLKEQMIESESKKDGKVHSMGQIRSFLEGRSGYQSRYTQSQHSVAQIRLFIEELQGMRKGAYAPFLWHPAFGTSLIAIIALLQYWVFGR